jgi:hypothetical protein
VSLILDNVGDDFIALHIVLKIPGAFEAILENALKATEAI